MGDGLPGTPLFCAGLLLLSFSQEWQEKKRAPFYKTYPKARVVRRCTLQSLTLRAQELVEPKSVEEDSAKQSWTAAPREGKGDSLRCHAALLPRTRTLSLVRAEVLSGGLRTFSSWLCGRRQRRPGSSLPPNTGLERLFARRACYSAVQHLFTLTQPQAGIRALTETAEGVEAHFVGNSPACHHAGADGRTTFFMRACYLGGDVKPRAANGFSGASQPPIHARLALRGDRRLGVGHEDRSSRFSGATAPRAACESTVKPTSATPPTESASCVSHSSLKRMCPYLET